MEGKEVRVSILNKNTLKLLEDANKGDLINLSNLTSIDKDCINKVIEETYKDKLQKELLEREKIFKLEKEKEVTTNQKQNDIEINKLKNNILSLEKELDSFKLQKENEIKIAINEFKNKQTKENNELIESYKEKIFNLQNELKLQNEKLQLNFEKEKAKLNSDHEIIFNKINNELSNIKELDKKELEIALNKKDAFYKEEITRKEQEIEQLKLLKTHLGTKEMGEDLEKWCNEEYESYALTGFNNAKWYKDNIALKDEDEEKASKADYIFEVYSSNDFKKEDLLTSVCCEIKNEGIDSIYKKKNSDHYAKLDKDRKKKNCEYALLISTLEQGSNNDAPIKKVQGYEKMYLVRPQYFVTFLSLLYNLANKYSELLKSDEAKKEEFKSSTELLELFEHLKTTYIEKPLTKFEKDVKDAYENSLQIEKYNNKNKEILNGLIQSDLQNIQEKILKFDIRKIQKKLDSINK